MSDLLFAVSVSVLVTFSLRAMWGWAYESGHRRGFSDAMRVCADAGSDPRPLARLYATKKVEP